MSRQFHFVASRTDVLSGVDSDVIFLSDIYVTLLLYLAPI